MNFLLSCSFYSKMTTSSSARKKILLSIGARTNTNATVRFYISNHLSTPVNRDLTCIVETLLKYSTAIADAGTNAPASEWSTETAQRIVDLREQSDEMLFLRRALTSKKVRTTRVSFECKLGDRRSADVL